MTREATPRERKAARAFQRGKLLPQIAKILGRTIAETDRWLDSPELLAALPPKLRIKAK